MNRLALALVLGWNALTFTACVDEGEAPSGPYPDGGAPGVDAEVPDAPHEDGGTADAAPTVPDAEPPPEDLGPTYYPTSQTLSPLSQQSLNALREIETHADDLRGNIFAKVGASATVSSSFLHCLAGDASRIDLDGRLELQSTIDHFNSGDAEGVSPFARDSLSTTVGWAAARALRGDPSPLEQEVEAIQPRLAVIMYGTNDVGYRNLHWYADNMLTLVDRLIDRGVIPLLTTIMPRDDGDWVEDVRLHNSVVRGIAQGRQVPLIDYHREMEPLPDHGLSGDLIHPTTFRDGRRLPCAFHPEGLRYGYNIRNLITLQTLHRVRGLMDGTIEPEAGEEAIVGEGTSFDPIEISQFPFRDIRSTLYSESRVIDEYTGCDAEQDESGPEVWYRIDLDRARTLEFHVFDRGDVDIDLHLLDDTRAPDGCLQRAHQTLTANLPAGTYYLTLDTFVSSSGVERSGEYLLLVLSED